MKIKYMMGFIIITLFNLSIFSRITTQSTSINVASIQLQSSDVGNFEKMKSLAEQAKSQGAQLIIFPESSVFGWLNPAVFTEADPIPGKYSDKFVEIAKSINIWVATGLAEKGPKAGEGSLPNAYEAYDSGILINPQGEIVLHHRKYNVLKNAFNPSDCMKIFGKEGCNYSPGNPSDITTIETPFGKTSILVCADAYIPSQYNDGKALITLKQFEPNFVIVPWGITAANDSDCGKDYYNATGFASQAAKYLKSAFVVGSNGIGKRIYGKYLPSVYCGTSGFADPTGKSTEAGNPTETIVSFQIYKSFTAEAGPIWNTATDAPKKCPSTCTKFYSTWNGQWWTTIWGEMSVCQCVPKGM